MRLKVQPGHRRVLPIYSPYRTIKCLQSNCWHASSEAQPVAFIKKGDKDQSELSSGANTVGDYLASQSKVGYGSSSTL